MGTDLGTTLSARAKRKAIRRAVNDALAKTPAVPIASQFLADRRPVDKATRLAVHQPKKQRRVTNGQ